jgi:type IX secretion system PorP/SprF family membrane protein
MKMRTVILFISTLYYTFSVAQQMPVTGLFEQNQTFYNPGATGNQEVLTAIFGYRMQWTGFSGSPNTQLFSAHAPLKNPDIAMGILVEHDAIGSTNYTGVFLNYAYRIEIGSNRLAFGLKGGITSGSQEYIALRDDNPDPAWSDNNRTFYVPNFGVGVSFYSRKYWAGLSIPRLFGYENNASDNYRMKQDFSKYEYFFSGGGRFSVNPNLRFDPSLLFIYSPSYMPSLTINTMAVFKDAYKAGLGYRSGDALILLIGYSLNRQFNLSYSYDLEIGKIADYTSGSHEINILYKFGYKVNASNPRQF